MNEVKKSVWTKPTIEELPIEGGSFPQTQEMGTWMS